MAKLRAQSRTFGTGTGKSDSAYGWWVLLGQMTRSQKTVGEARRRSVDCSTLVRELYVLYQRPIYNFFANRQRFETDECRDLTQETFVRVSRDIERFRGEAEASTWLWSIAKNVWLEAERNRSRLKRAAPVVSLDELKENSGFDVGDEKDESPLERCLEEEQMRLLREALQLLPPQMRVCIRLRIFQGLRYREIAEVMQTSIGTVKSQLAEARERLRSRLSPNFTVDL